MLTTRPTIIIIIIIIIISLFILWEVDESWTDTVKLG